MQGLGQSLQPAALWESLGCRPSLLNLYASTLPIACLVALVPSDRGTLRLLPESHTVGSSGPCTAASVRSAGLLRVSLTSLNPGWGHPHSPLSLSCLPEWVLPGALCLISHTTGGRAQQSRTAPVTIFATALCRCGPSLCCYERHQLSHYGVGRRKTWPPVREGAASWSLTLCVLAKIFHPAAASSEGRCISQSFPVWLELTSLPQSLSCLGISQE